MSKWRKTDTKCRRRSKYEHVCVFTGHFQTSTTTTVIEEFNSNRHIYMDPIAQPEALPISVPIPGGVRPNRFIVIDGRINCHAVTFSVRLQTGPSLIESDDAPLYIRFYFESNRSCFSVNSFLNHQSGTPVGNYRHIILKERCNSDMSYHIGACPSSRGYPDVPLRRGDCCGLVIDCTDKGFIISVKSIQLCEFPHRADYTKIKYLVLSGDFHVSAAGVAGNGPMRWMIRASSGSYQRWKQRYIHVLNDETVGAKVLSSREAWLLLLYSEQCEFQALWEDVASHLQNRVKVGVIDVLENLDTAIHLGLKESPVIVLFPKGEKDWNYYYNFDGDLSTAGIVMWTMHQLNEWNCEYTAPPQSIRPLTTPIVMVERESWQTTFRPLLDRDNPKDTQELETSEPNNCGSSNVAHCSNIMDPLQTALTKKAGPPCDVSLSTGDLEETMVLQWLHELNAVHKDGATERTQRVEKRLREIAERSAADITPRIHIAKLRSSISANLKAISSIRGSASQAKKVLQKPVPSQAQTIPAGAVDSASANEVELKPRNSDEMSAKLSYDTVVLKTSPSQTDIVAMPSPRRSEGAVDVYSSEAFTDLVMKGHSSASEWDRIGVNISSCLRMKQSYTNYSISSSATTEGLLALRRQSNVFEKIRRIIRCHLREAPCILL